MQKIHWVRCRINLIIIITIMTTLISGWLVRAGGAAIGQGGAIWEDVPPPVAGARQADGLPGRRQLRLNRLALARLLEQAPQEAYRGADDRRVELPLPMPDGSTLQFRLEESPIMEPALAARYPEIRTYTGQSIDDPAVMMRCDLTPDGFHATVLQADRTISIHPVSDVVTGVAKDVPGDRYVSYQGSSAIDGMEMPVCDLRAAPPAAAGAGAIDGDHLRQWEVSSPGYQVGGTLRTFRLAMATTWEYANTFGGGTNAGTVASMVTWLNAVNAIYEREVAVRLQLIDAPSIIYSAERGFTSTSDPFTNGNSGTMLSQLGPVMATAGTSNFDVGHVLGTGGSGVAYLGVVCREATVTGGPVKGLGVTNIGGSLGNSGGVYILTHELGHQFGAYHTFNGTLGNCGGSNRTGNSAFEPGSGMTVMSYAGGCGTDNIVNATDRNLRFHVGSLRQILGHLEAGGRCFKATTISNGAPAVDAGPDYTIPRATPFELRATGSDPDAADAGNLTYVWEQTDVGLNFSNPPYTDSGDPDMTTRPIFRSYAPVAAPNRVFPGLNYILNYANTPPETISGLRTAESLPAVGRVLNFGVAVRDNRSGGGGMAEDGVRLTVAAGAGPFRVTAPNSALTWAGGSVQTVTWLVSNTNLDPINCTQVRISLSTDGGQTFPVILSPATANDGNETIVVPAAIATTQARIKVEAVGNIFFDISDAGFTITSSGTVSLPTITTFALSPAAPQASAPFGGTVTGTNLVTGATQVWFCVDGTATCTAAPASAINVTSPTSLTMSGITLGAGIWQLYLQTPAGASNRSTTFTVQPGAATAPTVSGFTWNPSPPVAGQSFNGTISGANFIAGQTRLFFCASGAASCKELESTSLSYVSSSALNVTTASLTAGGWQLYVQTPAGPSNRSAVFTVEDPATPVPVISSYSWIPTPPVANEPFSGSISGSNFAAGATQVWFCAPESLTCTAAPTNSILVTSPSRLTLTNVSLPGGSWQFYLQTAAGNSARSTIFTVEAPEVTAPTITGFTWDPAVPLAGRPFTGTITGTNFVAAATRVYFCQNGRPFCQQHSIRNVTVADRTRLTLTNIILSTGAWQFYIVSAGGASSRSASFRVETTVTGVPTISGYVFNPVAPAPGTSFNGTINGANFVAGGTRLFFCLNGTEICQEVPFGAISVPTTSILIFEQFSLPAGAWQLYLSTSAGASPRSTTFTIQSEESGPPQITSHVRNPATPLAGEPFTLTVNGERFVRGATEVYICQLGTAICTRLAAGQITVAGPTSLTATGVILPAGNWQVYVQTAAGFSPRSTSFTVQNPPTPAPTITSYTLNPVAPAASQPFAAVITGTGFVVGATEVEVCVSGNPTCRPLPAASVTVTGATTLNLVNVSLGSGAWQFLVRTAAGISGRSTPLVIAPGLDLPAVTGYLWNPVTPEPSRPFTGTITGRNFTPGAEIFFCLEASANCVQPPAPSVTVVDSGRIDLTGISLASGKWQFFVRTAAGDSDRATTFEVNVRAGSHPTLTGYVLKPTVPRANVAFTGTINGANFEAAGTRVFFCQSGTSNCYLQPAANVTVLSGGSLAIVNVKLSRGSWQIYLQTSIARTDRSRPFLVM